MKTIYSLLITIVFVGCLDSGTEKEMPEIINDLKLMSNKSPEHLELNLEITELTTDSLLISFFLKNTNEINDTLFHSSNFPLHVAFSGDEELTPPLIEQIFFDDLESIVVKGNSSRKINITQVKKLSKSPYKIIGLFRYKKDSDPDSTEFWLITDPTII